MGIDADFLFPKLTRLSIKEKHVLFFRKKRKKERKLGFDKLKKKMSRSVPVS